MATRAPGAPDSSSKLLARFHQAEKMGKLGFPAIAVRAAFEAPSDSTAHSMAREGFLQGGLQRLGCQLRPELHATTERVY